MGRFRWINAALGNSKMRARFADLGGTALAGSRADFGKLIAEETGKWALWKVNTGSGFCAPPMTFEVNGKQYLAITSGPSTPAKAKLVNTPELKEQRNATVLYVFAL
jgi:hypothetical protein